MLNFYQHLKDRRHVRFFNIHATEKENELKIFKLKSQLFLEDTEELRHKISDILGSECETIIYDGDIISFIFKIGGFMKLREKTNIEICDENNLPFTILSNVVEETSTKDKMRATSNLIAKALTATGPYGTSTIIQDREGRHFATKDGYDLMNRLTFEDEVLVF